MEGRSLFLVSIVLLMFVDNSISRRTRKRADNPLEDWQKRALEKLQVLAREGGLAAEDWTGITNYDKDVCYESDCLASALEVIEATNFTTDPCTDWLAFVCDRRVRGPDNINQLERLMRVVETRTKDLLLNDSPESVPGNFLLKEAQTYYYQCVNKKYNDSNDIKDILNYLDTTYGGWPMLTNTDPGPKFDWFRMVADLNRIDRIGYKPLLLQLTTSSDSQNLQLSMGQLSLPINFQDFVTMMTRIQQGSGKNKPARLDQFSDMLQFVYEVRQASLVAAANSTLTIQQLQWQTDNYFRKNSITNLNIDWLKFFQNALQGSDIKVTLSEPPVQLPFNQVMSIMQTVSKFFNNNQGYFVSNALNFQLTSMLLQESTEVLDDIYSFKCTEQTGAREQICYDRTIEIFGYSLGKTYLLNYYNEDVDTPAIEEMMGNIQRGYLELINGLSYMADSTKDKLRDKIISMKTFVAQPDWTKDPEKLKNFYGTLTASTDKNSSFPLNYLNVTSWKTAKERSHALKLATMYLSDMIIYEMEWSRYLGTVQAMFNRVINQARIEGGIVQTPFFGVNNPGFMNYGGLGMVLAHEIGHSYDTLGRLYSKNGVKGEFWDAESVKQYNIWVQSILRDYGRAVHQTSDTDKQTIGADKTVNEDIADILGVYISFLAYKEYLTGLEAQGKSEKILPGLKNYNPQKLFYMKYGNMWCDRKGVQDRFNDLLGDHSDGNTRATLPLQRSREFAKTFGCQMPVSSS